jgi:predicted metal-dependent enzyme (double-stranded beta helix superfamily)
VLDRYVKEVGSILHSGVSLHESVKKITKANDMLCADEGFCLPDRLAQARDGVPYTRNLVYQDPNRKFTVIALVWGAFQETKVHDHLNWCVVKVLEGRCHSIEYDRMDDESKTSFADLQIRKSSVCTEGSVVSLLPPPRSNIHRMSNAGRVRAITLHTYGDPGTRARVFDPVTGEVSIVELEFHNLD